MKTGFRRLRRRQLVIFLFVMPLLFSGPVRAGSYLDSAHGSSTDGVLRLTGYARGNCAHCHEQHASIGGTEPAPVNGAAPYTLFAGNFDTSVTTGPYSESNDFCFYCHDTSTASVIQPVTNYDYSKVFGGAGALPASIMAAFNQLSYHNLYDVWNFAKTNFSSWFTSYSNPCNACHNPHLARQNYLAPQQSTVAGALLLSAISRPSNHFALWGTTTGDTMYGVYGTQYEPPYSSGTSTFEPAGLTDATTSGQRTPDYVALCTDCHTSTNATIHSTSISGAPSGGRFLLQIDWSAGDQHGAYAGTGTRVLKAPYTDTGTNYVLSCLDCHEPHGSPNITLLRRRVNGGDLLTAITAVLLPGTGTTDSNHKELGYLCRQCHKDDAAADGGNSNAWEYVHHYANNNPYNRQGPCRTCHGKPWNYIACDKCHYHGATVTNTRFGGTTKTF